MSGHGGVLARRLLWRVLLFSLCFTVLAGAVQLFFEYRREMREIEARLELIRSGYLASFERSLWDLNQEQLNVQLRGLGDFPDIARVSLQSADFNLLQGDQRPRGMLRVERFPELPAAGGERRQLGELEIAIDLAAVYRRLVSGGLASLLWMGSFLWPGGGPQLAVPQPGHSPSVAHVRVRRAYRRRRPATAAATGQGGPRAR